MTRELLSASSYAELSMEKIAIHARVGKKTLYRRWPSKAPLVAEAVLDVYGRSGSFDVPRSHDLRADLRSWLVEHSEFIADAANAALIRALIAAAAANPADNEALDQQLSVPQHAGLMTRLQEALDIGQLKEKADINAIANALIGVLILHVLNRTSTTDVDGLLTAVLDGTATKLD
ncbi:MAG TPA: TetR/AcrR family transcriptional regulator [Mycobacterium sp.]